MANCKIKKSIFGVLIILFLSGLILKQNQPSNDTVDLEISNLKLTKSIFDNNLNSNLKSIVNSAPTKVDFRLGNRKIQMGTRDQFQTYYYFNSGLLQADSNNFFQVPLYLGRKIADYFSEMENEYCAKDISWSEVKNIFSKNKNALITDSETGLCFNVSRKAGSWHADVQPLTAKDTEIMKEIYGGSWSWRRRAIILTVDEKQIAASMNGMPHGAGSIRNNNFPGHFCIHFAGSKVHKSNRVDQAHQLMIAKAGGKLDTIIFNANPEELITIFFTMLKQHDWNTAMLLLGFKNTGSQDSIFSHLKLYEDIKSIAIHTDEIKAGKELQSIPVSITWQRKGETHYAISTLLLSVRKSFAGGEWYIEADSIKQQSSEPNNCS